MYSKHSFPIPPVEVKIRGVKVPCSMSKTLLEYRRFFSFSWLRYICWSSRSLYESALGWKTLTSKNADRWFSQNPREWISNLASGARLEPLPSCSPEISWRISWQNLYSALSWRSKRFTTLCGGLCQTAYLGANCRHAVHNLIKENLEQIFRDWYGEGKLYFLALSRWNITSCENVNTRIYINRHVNGKNSSLLMASWIFSTI